MTGMTLLEMKRNRIRALGFQTQLIIWTLLGLSLLLQFTVVKGNGAWVVVGIQVALTVGALVRQLVGSSPSRLSRHAARKVLEK